MSRSRQPMLARQSFPRALPPPNRSGCRVEGDDFIVLFATDSFGADERLLVDQQKVHARMGFNRPKLSGCVERNADDCK